MSNDPGTGTGLGGGVRRVFISYAHEDEALARAVATDIEDFGHMVFIDDDVIGGEDWWDRILSEIERCDRFFVIVSKDWRASLACRREYFHAAQLPKHVLGVAQRSVPHAALDILGSTQIEDRYG